MRGWFGHALGKPVIEAVLWIYRKLRERAYRDVEGRYYQYKTNPIDIVEGPQSERWLLVPNVRRSITGLPEFAVLQRLYPSGVRRDQSSRSERIEARTLVRLLDKAQDMQTRRFVVWLRREVIFPSDRKAVMKQ